MFKVLRFLFFISIFLIPLSLRSSVVVNEIMYDLPGRDNGREWIEIYNNGEELIDLSGWNIETTANHRPFVLVSGSFEISSGGFALVVQDYDQFKNDWPSFYGTVFKSIFSLKNKEGFVALKEGEKTVDRVLYNSSSRAQEDGQSLQRFGEVWLPSLPTPGRINIFVPNKVIMEEEKEVISSNIVLDEKPEEGEKKTSDSGIKEEIKVVSNDKSEKSAKDPNPYLVASTESQNDSGVLKFALTTLIVLTVASLPILFSRKKIDQSLLSIKDIKIIEQEED